MVTKIFAAIAVVLLITSSFTQDYTNTGSYQCYLKKISNPNPVFTRGDSPNTPKHKFDVLDYKIYVDIRSCFITPYPKNFSGSVIIKFRVDTALSSITLNAVNTSLQITSVSMSAVSFTHASDILTLNLDRTYNPNEIVYVKIDYNHQNVTDGAFYAGGGGVMTDCEPEGARKWFPCWDKPYDKATVDLTAKVPANVKLGSNGRLNDSTLTGDTLYYHWISRDPVATYLVVISAKVNWKLDIVNAYGTPIRFYYNTTEALSAEGYIADMLGYYSGKFGPHAFEKNGFTTAAASGFPWGGMENQTLTTLCSSCWGVGTVSHEFAHQWFGDAVTCGTWADIWLNEGFATYTEALWLEHTSGYSSYKSDIIGDASSYLSGNPGWPMYNPSWAVITPNNNTLFNYAITYAKGACVLHMLRYVLTDTTVFFNCLRGYYGDTANFKYKNAVTDDFTAKISQVAGQDLTWFIDEWVKQPNHPVYANIYQFVNAGGGNWNVGFKAVQTQTNTPFHRMPLTLRISFTSGPDTTILVNNIANDQIWWWTFNRQPSAFSFDPNNDIVLKQGTTSSGVVGITINSNEIPSKFGLNQNYPNPFNPVTNITFQLPKSSLVELKVFDITGRHVSTLYNGELPAGKYTANFDASNLSSGIYFYQIHAGAFSDRKKMILIK